MFNSVALHLKLVKVEKEVVNYIVITRNAVFFKFVRHFVDTQKKPRTSRVCSEVSHNLVYSTSCPKCQTFVNGM